MAATRTRSVTRPTCLSEATARTYASMASAHAAAAVQHAAQAREDAALDEARRGHASFELLRYHREYARLLKRKEKQHSAAA